MWAPSTTLSPDVFQRYERWQADSATTGWMTVQGTALRCLALATLAGMTATWSWTWVRQAGPLATALWLVGAILVMFLVGAATRLRHSWAPLTAPVYATVGGFATGGVSAGVDWLFPGVVFHAVVLTLGLLVTMLVAYATGSIRPSARFRNGLAAAMSAIALAYTVDAVLRLVGVPGLRFIHETGLLAIAFNVAVIAVAALQLTVDFEAINAGARQGSPAYMEWYAAYSLLVTTLWLYLEVLRVLTKVRENGPAVSAGKPAW